MAEHRAPVLRTIEDARVWIDILHRRSVDDAQRMNLIETRLSLAEAPWWRFGQRRRRREYVAFVRRTIEEHRG